MLRHQIKPELLENFYTYSAFVTKVYDGDTITCDIQLGMSVVLANQKIRLFGINAPELRGHDREQGIKARDWLRVKLLYKTVNLITYKDKKGKYGRYLADVFIDGTCVNDDLVVFGYAEYKDY